jgi:hypothetical protein
VASAADADDADCRDVWGLAAEVAAGWGEAAGAAEPGEDPVEGALVV